MRILIVDDEPTIRFALEELLGDRGNEVVAFDAARAALAYLQDHDADLVISDLSMPGMDGLALLDEVHARYPDLPFALMTAVGDERTAVRTLKSGAVDYLPKPFRNEEVLAIVERVRERSCLRSTARTAAPVLTGVVAESPAMQRLFAELSRIAASEATVLLTGESGSGKEVVARAVHDASRRAKQPLIALNCGAIPAELMEGELFGHVRGAFTSADRDQKGLFAAADRGTLFLDEVGELPLTAQTKLLRVLEERKVTPLGSTTPQRVDVRLIAATNRDLGQMVRSGAFRADLLYRLQVVEVTVPPLRDRSEDVMPLVVHFLNTFAAREKRKAPLVSERARAALLQHSWPGNVRELRNSVERAFVVCDTEVIDLRHLPRDVNGLGRDATEVDDATPFAAAREKATEEFDREFLTAALRRNEGNVSRTARELGVHRQSLQKMMRRLGLERG